MIILPLWDTLKMLVIFGEEEQSSAPAMLFGVYDKNKHKRRLRRAEVAEWQTHGTQNPARATSCGFDSHLRHQKKRTLKGSFFILKTIISHNGKSEIRHINSHKNTTNPSISFFFASHTK